MQRCRHCGGPIAQRPAGGWVHRNTRSRYCSLGPIPRPVAAPGVEARKP